MKIRPFLLALAACGMVSPIAAEFRPPGPASPRYFERNRGQADASIRYLARTPAYVQLFADDGISWESYDGAPPVRMTFAGARRGTTAEGMDRRSIRVSYLLGKDQNRWIRGVESFGRIRYSDLYSGIAAEFRHSNSDLEYDFVVSPGARVGDIHLEFHGASRVTLLDSGDLIAGEIHHRALRAYQMIGGVRQSVAAQFRLIRRGPTPQVGFVVGPYDHRVELFIDPVLSYEVAINAGAPDTGGCTAPGYNCEGPIITAMAVSPAGDVYVAGWAWFGGLPGISSGLGVSGAKTFIGRLTPDGSEFLYLSYIGGSGDDTVEGLNVDGAGNAWLCGSTDSADFPVTSKLPGPGSNKSQTELHNGFIAAVDPTGTTLVYSALLGGSGDDRIQAIGVTGSGAVWVAGSTTSPDFPVTVSAFQKSLRGPQNAFVACINALFGTLFISTYFGGSGTDTINKLAVDAQGDAYLAGNTFSPDLPIAGNVLQPTPGGGGDVFFAKVRVFDGSLAWSTYYGGPNGEELDDMVADGSGNIYASVTGTEQPLPQGSGPAVIAGATLLKIEPDGSALAYSNDSFVDLGAISADSQGRVTAFATFSTSSYTPDALAACGNFFPGGLIRLEPDGHTVSYFSAALGDLIATDASDAVYLAGFNMIQKQDFSAPTPAMRVTCVRDANSFDYNGSVAPGEFVAIYGPELGPATALTASPDSAGRLPLNLGGVTVTFDGTPAALLSVSATKVEAIVPFETVGRILSWVQVSNGSSAAPATPVAIEPATDILGFLKPLNEDGTVNSADNPATPGSIVTVYSTGGGQTNPPSMDGQIARTLAPLLLPVEVDLFRISFPYPDPNPLKAEVLYAGAAPGQVAGVVRIDLRVPARLGNSPIRDRRANFALALRIDNPQSTFTSGAIYVGARSERTPSRSRRP